MNIKRNFKEKFGFFEDGSRMAPLDWGYDSFSNSGEALRDDNHPKASSTKEIGINSINQDNLDSDLIVEEIRKSSINWFLIGYICLMALGVLLVFIVLYGIKNFFMFLP